MRCIFPKTGFLGVWSKQTILGGLMGGWGGRGGLAKPHRNSPPSECFTSNHITVNFMRQTLDWPSFLSRLFKVQYKLCTYFRTNVSFQQIVQRRCSTNIRTNVSFQLEYNSDKCLIFMFIRTIVWTGVHPFRQLSESVLQAILRHLSEF